MKKTIIATIAICLLCSIFAQVSFAAGNIIALNCNTEGNTLNVSGIVENGIKGAKVGLVILKAGADLENVKQSDYIGFDQTVTEFNGGKITFKFTTFLMAEQLSPGTYTVKISGEGINSSTVSFTYEDVQNYYVSSAGNDSGTGSLYSPFRTIQKARDAIRNYKSQSNGQLPKNVNVYIRGGSYYAPAAIEFDERDSGNN